MNRKIEISFGTNNDSDKDYREECLKLSPEERIACVQRLRESFWGSEASTGRLQRIPEFIERKTS